MTEFDVTRKPRVDHIERHRPPWLDESLTECGLNAAEHPNVTWGEVARRVKTLGQERTRFTLCQTCAGRSHRGAAETWERDPAGVLVRHFERVHSSDPDAELQQQARAIAAVVMEHIEEYRGFLTDLQSTVQLKQRRDAKAKRRGGPGWR